ncbi:MAG TPA: phosphonate metabolism transcriptional regulator PhnF [Ramlibacter sp.]|nr:phosphonate metabolism transcriptional regulator PhnF [Ramlibacter sp.]
MACAPRESLWMQVASRLSDAIGRGQYPPGERLPSEHELASSFGVHRHTLRRALAELGRQGLVRASQGSGTFVEKFALDLALGRRTRHRHGLAQAGVRGGLRVLSGEVVSAGAEEARALDAPEGSALLRLRVLGEAGGQPMQVSERFFPLPRFAGLREIVEATGSITQAFQAHGVADYTRNESRISARMPTAEVADCLRQAPTRPVLRVTSVNVDTQGRPIEFSTAWFAGDRITLTVKDDEN